MIQLWRLMVLAAVAAVVLQMKCTSVVSPDDIPSPLPDDLALFASFDGNWAGIKVIDPNTLANVDSLESDDRRPIRVEFSPDYREWYSIKEQTTQTRILYAIDAKSKTILRTAPTTGSLVTTDRLHRYLITYGYGAGVTQIFDRLTFQLLRTDSLGLLQWIVASPTQNTLYAIHQTYRESFTGILVYNLDSLRAEKTLRFDDFLAKVPTDLAISPDGQYLFLTAFTWMGFGGVGTFYAIDLTTERIVATYNCGSYSQIGLATDGKAVYLSDPAGYLYELPPTNQILRYDVGKRSIEVFIDGLAPLGLKGTRLVTDQIVIGPDSKTMFVAHVGDAKTADGRDVHMAKLDLLTKRVLSVYSIPRDYRGYVTTRITRLRLAKRPMDSSRE